MANDQTVYGASTYGTGKYSPNAVLPLGIVDNGGVGAPAIGSSSITGPTPLIDTETVGSATSGGPAYNNTYSFGTYGSGVYSGTLGEGFIPDSTVDPEIILTPTATGDEIVNIGYGSGIYGTGSYAGSGDRASDSIIDPDSVGRPTITGAGVQTSANYGAGVYGDGPYTGTLPGQGGAATPLPTPPVTRVYPDPLHLLAVGPWNPVKSWRGATNYGIGKGIHPARPALQLPGIQAKSFTLRLDGGTEATVTVQTTRRDAVIVEELATDLWWRRKDPRTGKLEMIGRLNCSHNDLSRADDGTLQSSLQFQDYRILLGNRMVLRYKDTANAESQWDTGAWVTEILKFAIPRDLGIDLTPLDDPNLLGTTTAKFHLPPSNTIADTIAAVQAISSGVWEWWIDTPLDVNLPPKITFAVTRGVDKGVTLFDYGTGPTPIATWQMRATGDSYANAIYFQGGTNTAAPAGGIVRINQEAVTEYGQRDTQVSDNSVIFLRDAAGTLLNPQVADRQLAALSDRRPTFTLTLKPGFWRGRAHIDVGDTVRLRIKLGGEMLSYEYRVSEIQVDVDGNGAESVSLTLGKPLPSRNPRSQYSPLFKLIRTLKNYEPPFGA